METKAVVVVETEKVPPNKNVKVTETAEQLPAKKGKKISFEERKESQKLESAIEKLQKQVIELQTKLDSSPANVGYSVLTELSNEIQSLKSSIEEKEIRWLEILAKE